MGLKGKQRTDQMAKEGARTLHCYTASSASAFMMHVVILTKFFLYKMIIDFPFLIFSSIPSL